MTRLTNATLFDLDRWLPGRWVDFDATIAATGPMAELPPPPPGCRVVDLGGQVLMPGLALGHTHIYSTFARGWATPFAPRSFREMLEQLWWKLDAGLDRDAVWHSGLVAAADLACAGVSAVVDHHASGRVVRGSLACLKEAVCGAVGLRGVFCFESSDRFPLEQCIEENLDFAQSCRAAADGMAAGLFGMHAGMTLSEPSLAAIAARRGGLGVHVHVAESAEDQADSLAATGLRVVERLDRHGLLDSGSLLAHCVHVDAAERRLAAARGCSVALNPSSNLNNAVGLPDFAALRADGLPLLLGTDGLGANPARDIQNALFAFRHRAADPLAVGLADIAALLRANWDFAGRALGVRLGRIEAGYAADLVSVPYAAPTPVDAGNALGHWFYGMLDQWRPANLWCAGRQILFDGRLPDQAAINAAARPVAERIWRQLAGPA